MTIGNNIKAIIFDLGGVILNIDYQLTSRAFEALGIKNFDNYFSKAIQNNKFSAFEKGEVSANELRNYLREQVPTLTDHEIDKAWNAILQDLPESRVNLLRNLKNNYRLFLLSNTNIIHEEAYHENMITEYGNNVFNEIFEKVYYSHRIGKRKPDEDCFEFVLKDIGLKAEECLFIDDSIQHIESASKLKMNTHHLIVGEEDIIELFKDTTI